MRVPAPIAGEFHRLGTAVREKRMTVEQALKEIAQICVDRHEHFGLMLTPVTARDDIIEECAEACLSLWREASNDRASGHLQNRISHGCIASAERIRSLRGSRSAAPESQPEEKP